MAKQVKIQLRLKKKAVVFAFRSNSAINRHNTDPTIPPTTSLTLLLP